MAKRIFAAAIVLLLLVGGYYAWLLYRTKLRASNGDVLSADGSEINSGDATAEPALAVTTAPAKQASASTGVGTFAGSQPQNSGQAASGTPAADSLRPNAPNGAAFAGTGKFQVYRQGNLTWRVNTDDGSTCILFATNEEWRKPVVYNHGCGTS